MLAFLQRIEEQYGGAEEYLRKYVGLTDEDIITLRRTLLVPKLIPKSSS